MSGEELRPLLSYLRDLGWDQAYSQKAVGVASGHGPVESSGSPNLEPAELSAAPPSSIEPTQGAPGVEGGADLVALGQDVEGCVACPLSEGRHRVVFGSGSSSADLMFVGEGPGYHEDQQGLPFVGKAGELLTRIIAAIDMTRDQVYIANIVKCRPPNNRDPRPEEVAACIGYLRRQIELIEPRVIVALGRVAAQTLLESASPIGRLRGVWHSYRGVPLRVTYHPAALLRNTSLKRPTWEDMQVVRDALSGGAPESVSP